MSMDRPFLKKDFAGLVSETLMALRSPSGAREPLDDATEGSVLRTLVEAFSRELAVCYQQLETVYKAGYLDTAEGIALDKVVALLGVARHQAGWLEGDVVFSRATPAQAEIVIPAGTLVAGKGVQGFETVVSAAFASGDTEVRVPVRSLVPEGDVVAAGALSILNRPIAGVETVSNPGALLPRRSKETDEDLRTRARNAIRGGRTATVDALARAVRALGLVDVQVTEDPASPGRVKVILADEDLSDAELAAVDNRLQEVRPVGVRVELFRANTVKLQVRATVLLDAELDAQAKARVQDELTASVERHFDGLRIGQTVHWNQIRNLITAHPRVAEVELSTDGGSPPVAAWCLIPIGPDGAPQTQSANGPPRLLGTAETPIGVFIGADERPQLHQLSLDLQAPALPAWIDIEMTATASLEPASLRAAVVEAFPRILPPEPLSAPLTASWQQLQVRLLADLLASGIETDEIDGNRLRFIVLHSRDGRVTRMAREADASEQDSFAVREAIVLRTVHVRIEEPGA